MASRLIAAILVLVAVHPLNAQQNPPATMQHRPGMVHNDTVTHEAVVKPKETGQSAFAAITEIVQLLEANPTTDWSKVNIEALRQHLMDMDAVTLRSRVVQTTTPHGLVMDITGAATTAASIRRMVTAHAPMLEQVGGWRATTANIPGGIRLTVTAINPADTALVTKIRGLGFIGLMTQGAHHAEHHLAIATGAGDHAHGAP